MRNKLVRGIPASPGIVMSRVVVGVQYIEPLSSEPEIKEVGSATPRQDTPASEITKFKMALEKTRLELEQLRSDFQHRTDEAHARILDAQLLVIEDPTLISGTINKITKENLPALSAFKKTVKGILSGFAKVKDEYIKARISDIKDVANRVLHNLGGQPSGEKLVLGSRQIPSGYPTEHDAKHIVISHDLSPSDIAHFNKEKVCGFATDLGGSTSHTSIMARALGIPAVVGLGNITKLVTGSEEIIIDGNRGVVIIEPNESTRRVYEDKIVRFQQYEQELLSLAGLPCETLDGYSIELGCNIELPDEIELALSYGADAIGLMRTEFLYLKSDRLPTEEEQFKTYNKLAEKVTSLTVRTLDLGGDKLPIYMQSSDAVRVSEVTESNPALGWRGIRFSLTNRDIFMTQLKAIIRSNSRGNVRILFPMIHSLDELRLAKFCVNEVSANLNKSGIPYGKNIEIGVMIEVPSAVLVASAIAKEVDFISIGSNDLTQYTLACDRGNPFVAQIYNPLHPAVLKLIKWTVDSSHGAHKWVSLCGELASYAPAIPILIGLGVDELSVSPIYLLRVKKLIRSLSMGEAKSIAREVLELDSELAIKKYIEDEIASRLPVVKELISEMES